ncbi:Peptidase M23B [Patulibacter medicamentivorans]|uniref:Peptidase M23B n=1 Tax=Patulibacter medicamentivorans TaxID=1097667 RepID=H0E5Y5_9ACTN|nr:lytic murein transglycosylase [Patulibacter medicamentivorans]EHN10926.1 Peptidase M23B [Patulibacter medicamentivorans]
MSANDPADRRSPTRREPAAYANAPAGGARHPHARNGLLAVVTGVALVTPAAVVEAADTTPLPAASTTSSPAVAAGDGASPLAVEPTTTAEPPAATETTPPPTTTTPAPPPGRRPGRSDPLTVDGGGEGRKQARDSHAAAQERRAAERKRAREEAAKRRAKQRKDKAQKDGSKASGGTTPDAAGDAPPTDGGDPLPDAPTAVPNLFLDRFRIPPFLLPIYQAAGIQYGIRWEVLAAINEIETDYGRNLSVSSAGALGWMQFMPATWETYGTDANGDGKADPFNPVDAIFAAARYLRAAGADQDIRKAIFAYNHADWYVRSVLLRARLIAGLPADLVSSLAGLTQGMFPVDRAATYDGDDAVATSRRKATGSNAAKPVESGDRRSIEIRTAPGAAAVAVQDGEVTRIGESPRLGKFVQLRDVYGNTYTYAHLKSVESYYPAPKDPEAEAARGDEPGQPTDDPKPTRPATAGTARPGEGGGEPDGASGGIGRAGGTAGGPDGADDGPPGRGAGATSGAGGAASSGQGADGTRTSGAVGGGADHAGAAEPAGTSGANSAVAGTGRAPDATPLAAGAAPAEGASAAAAGGRGAAPKLQGPLAGLPLARAGLAARPATVGGGSTAGAPRPDDPANPAPAPDGTIGVVDTAPRPKYRVLANPGRRATAEAHPGALPVDAPTPGAEGAADRRGEGRERVRRGRAGGAARFASSSTERRAGRDSGPESVGGAAPDDVATGAAATAAADHRDEATSSSSAPSSRTQSRGSAADRSAASTSRRSRSHSPIPPPTSSLPPLMPVPGVPAPIGDTSGEQQSRTPDQTPVESQQPAPGAEVETITPGPYAPPSDSLATSGSDPLPALGDRPDLAALHGLKPDQMTYRPLKRGARVLSGTSLGRVGSAQTAAGRRDDAGQDGDAAGSAAPADQSGRMTFQIRPAGRGAPRIDPKPILDGWKLLESTAVYRAKGRSLFGTAGAGQVLLMSKAQLQQRVLADRNLSIYPQGRADIEAGAIDRRVLATLEFLTANGLRLTITSLRSGHGLMTASGNVSEHSSGNAVDIAAVNGITITPKTQGPGTITESTIRLLLQLQGAMKPHQIISLMTFTGADNTMSLPDHDDHIHVGFRPEVADDPKLGRQVARILKPGQWTRLIDRIGQIDNPKVLTEPSKYAVRVKRGR